MKNLILIITVIVLSFTSCNKSNNSDNSQFSKSISKSISPCDYIDKQMIVCHFGMSNTKLKFQDLNNESSNITAQCGYSWKKSNINDAGNTFQTNRKSKNNHIKIGNFRTYDDIISAASDFKKTYWVTSNENVKKGGIALNNEESRDVLNEKLKNLSDNFQVTSKGGLKLTEVYGVGDQAFYDHQNKSLDVRFGTLSFSVFIETEMDTETNILIAKKLALEVWEKL